MLCADQNSEVHTPSAVAVSECQPAELCLKSFEFQVSSDKSGSRCRALDISLAAALVLHHHSAEGMQGLLVRKPRVKVAESFGALHDSLPDRNTAVEWRVEGARDFVLSKVDFC